MSAFFLASLSFPNLGSLYAVGPVLVMVQYRTCSTIIASSLRASRTTKPDQYVLCENLGASQVSSLRSARGRKILAANAVDKKKVETEGRQAGKSTVTTHPPLRKRRGGVGMFTFFHF